tara:strand:+ start:264 stop:872 length:609 start_codon:yes stop_codon:yes gene_type:complete
MPEALHCKALRGVMHTLSNSLMRQALLITSLYAFLIRGTLEILPVIADGIFTKDAAGVGILTSIAGFGAVVAGITKVFTQSQKAGEIPKFVIASALLGVALIPLVGLSNTWELTVGYICYLGFAGTLSGISIQTALQMDLPDHFRGRVMSLWTVVNVGATARGDDIGGTGRLYWNSNSVLFRRGHWHSAIINSSSKKLISLQ